MIILIGSFLGFKKCRMPPKKCMVTVKDIRWILVFQGIFCDLVEFGWHRANPLSEDLFWIWGSRIAKAGETCFRWRFKARNSQLGDSWLSSSTWWPLSSCILTRCYFWVRKYYSFKFLSSWNPTLWGAILNLSEFLSKDTMYVLLEKCLRELT